MKSEPLDLNGIFTISTETTEQFDSAKVRLRVGYVSYEGEGDTLPEAMLAILRDVATEAANAEAEAWAEEEGRA